MTTGEQLRAMLASGELARRARLCSSLAELAEAVGVTVCAYKKARARIGGFPTLAQLQAMGEFAGDSIITDCDNEFCEEEPTQPGLTAEDVRIHAQATSSAGVPVPVLPPGHVLRGASSLVRPDGSVVQQWIKTSAKNDGRRDWLDAIRSVSSELPRFEPVPPAEVDDGDTLAVYPVGDPHIGLLAWHEDAGENFDMDIAERNLVAAFDHLVALAPASHEALMVYIGDTAHADGQANTTTKGTRVDVDGRTTKMASRIVRTIRRNVSTVLGKHQHARIIMERGNHDELISAMLALALSLLYENEPRVSVDLSPEMHHWYRFGANLIGTHHGDKTKPMDLLGVMAVDRAADWSDTKHRRFYCGHFHHLITKEVPGVVIDYLPTLAGSDAWHRSMGYRSARAMYMDVFHREFGHVNRHIVGIQQIAARCAP
jgi:hypothetical protein